MVPPSSGTFYASVSHEGRLAAAYVTSAVTPRTAAESYSGNER
jgi:hypothetical protein